MTNGIVAFFGLIATAFAPRSSSSTKVRVMNGDREADTWAAEGSRGSMDDRITVGRPRENTLTPLGFLRCESKVMCEDQEGVLVLLFFVSVSFPRGT